jgi:hypothetical protein
MFSCDADFSCHSSGRDSGVSEQMLNYVDSSGNEFMASVKGCLCFKAWASSFSSIVVMVSNLKCL